MEYTLKDLEKWNDRIEVIAKDFGLDYYNQEFEFVDYRDMLAYEAYLGMPSRYPHWSFGKAYEKNSTIYKYNLTGLPYEMVINSDPCIAYLMNENTLLLQILTMAHVYGHNDFFKNNRLFKEGTDAKYTVEMFKTDADMVRAYVKNPSIGYENVEKILDAAHAIKLQTSRVVGEKRVDEIDKKKRILENLNNEKRGSIIEPYKEKEVPDLKRIPLEPEEDVLYFILKYGDLNTWQQNLIEVVRKETQYFIPQIETKIMNEGWASFWHYNILKKLNLDSGLHLEFIKRHNDVIAPSMGSINPYFVGFKIYESLYKKYGMEKIFEVREIERDESFIRRYLNEELCGELNLFEYEKQRDDYVISEVSDKNGWTKIRDELCNSCGMGLIPNIRVDDMSSYDKTLTLEHVYDGRELNEGYAEYTLKYMYKLWGHPVILKTKIGSENMSIVCDNENKIYLRE
ncbi:MAG: SpoVR family protein [Clostridium sp.]|nr:SpoVR family protein [Clostridium sp.]